jgi:hypothetical protein
MYVYAHNTPLNLVDPYGLCSLEYNCGEIGTEGYGQFGYRPLGNPGDFWGTFWWMFQPWKWGHAAERGQILAHEQYWAGSWNIGYGPTGIFSDPSNWRNRYIMQEPKYDNYTMGWALNDLTNTPENQGNAYDLCSPGHNNCQDFALRLQEEYADLMSRCFTGNDK